MKRSHRRAHRAIWIVLAPLVLAGLYLAIDARPPIPVQELPASDNTPATRPPSQPADSMTSSGEQAQ